MVENETPSTAVINGNWGFGFVVTERAMRIAIEKAKTHGVAALTIRQQSHIGRLGDYPAMAVAEDMIGLITADSGAGPKSVAPFGGSDRRLGTNPICIGVPSDLEAPVVIDMATSAVAAGKIALYRSRDEQVPQGWLVDKDGQPTTDPNDYYAGGSILPVGADQGHKGYGLSFMVEVLSALLTGLGFGQDPYARHNDGCFVSVYNVEHFRPLKQFKQDVAGFAEFIKASPPAPGFNDVLYPGEIEHLTEQTRRRDGIFVEDSTWGEITGLMQSLGIDKEVGLP